MGSPHPGPPRQTDRLPSDAALDTDQLRQLIRDGRVSDVPRHAGRVIDTSADPYEVARAHLMKLGALIILGRTGECPAVVDRANAALQRQPDPALLGEFHALAGFVAHIEGSLDRCVMHLVSAGRVLQTVERLDITAADAWCDLAIAYSWVGFHEQATDAARRGLRIAEDSGLSVIEHISTEIGVRSAVSYDHRGDSERCRAELADLLHDTSRVLANLGGLAALRPDQLPYMEYAAARLAAMGHADAALPVTRSGGRSIRIPDAMELSELSAVCRAIAERRTDEALRRLDRVTVDPRTLGAAEVHRLRALAHAAASDHVAADAADRAAFRVASADLERVRALFVDGIAVRIDHEELRRTVGRYAGEALSDPLTGLPNRRHLEQRVEAISRTREQAVLGIIDLDDFKAVNTVHGHLTGDLVLQRVAGALIRVLRRRDFLARYGGDEFVVILPSATRAEAEIIGARLADAVRGEDWESLAPGTPVSASIGWAELHESTDLIDAFRKADREMFGAKKSAKISGG
ncbi:MAG: diguanylate cyclase [Micromonosporaceae bacterium]|nr:diguanylate cyclase [Micromonosporaceae bacterium]